MDKNEWQIYAVRYARHDRAARENFMAGDPHDDSPMPLDHYVWAVKSPGRTFVIDTGFDEPMARKRGRTSACTFPVSIAFAGTERLGRTAGLIQAGSQCGKTPDQRHKPRMARKTRTRNFLSASSAPSAAWLKTSSQTTA